MSGVLNPGPESASLAVLTRLCTLHLSGVTDSFSGHWSPFLPYPRTCWAEHTQQLPGASLLCAELWFAVLFVPMVPFVNVIESSALAPSPLLAGTLNFKLWSLPQKTVTSSVSQGETPGRELGHLS